MPLQQRYPHKKAAAHALGFLNDSKAANMLQRVLEKREKEVREAAKKLWAIKRWEDDII
ncbi:hypothetical protein [Lutispora thermophila]|uniref:HEAT repeat-containing protein n=1 Tax=Lutispora thermophila DSM 19022 TaxID=1122184 RepID=A0A1M6EK09_9FIRM|nr:hypothetical protein [Lutispora thermophila]SHI85610.1 hypothetical protein SAMN02745176_01597 [Lutispora thermophila DSM 19022]